ncbi:hypothetical protein PXO_05773 [Xanthomonas oryzae pv. oryzae PXO99A]|uniref:Uncharacterized protein n=1 Tax=Xanthomonas oryzae pv. oryzae (strain PXO99A) TaxID=360094 RepID=A0A0K0GR60_XANOP|nr:hypothetical protein PXO_05773 [Xanthomonas oryzae pv. oryzae PXO99A]
MRIPSTGRARLAVSAVVLLAALSVQGVRGQRAPDQGAKTS